MNLIKKIFKRGAIQESPLDQYKETNIKNDSCEYQLSTTCQIRELSTLYKLFLGYKTDGFFVEFGAFDGEYVCNTSGLADIGWEGIYIEPISEYYEKCKVRHSNNNVKVLQLAVGDNDDIVKISKGGPLSTISKEVIENFNKLNWANGIHHDSWEEVKQKPLNDILSENNVPTNFDILSIDVEGYEWNSLKTFDIDFWRPKIAIIELHDNNPEYIIEQNDAKKIINFFDNHKYRPIYKDLANTVYLRQDIQPLF